MPERTRGSELTPLDRLFIEIITEEGPCTPTELAQKAVIKLDMPVNENLNNQYNRLGVEFAAVMLPAKDWFFKKVKLTEDWKYSPRTQD